MIDLHSHIIPAIDDGATDLDTSLAMLDMAASNGTKGIVATPHVIEGEWFPEWETILSGCAQLRQSAAAMGLPIQIYPGAEVALNMDLLHKISGPGPYCINEGSYMLVELPALEIPDYTEDFFFQLQTKGIIPVLAHPERNPEITKDRERLLEWLHRGILFQLNGASLCGKQGKEIKAAAELLLKCNMIHCIGSDAHGVNSRRPILTEAITVVRQLSGEEMVRIISGINPERILNGLGINRPELETIKLALNNYPKRKWFIFGKKS